MNSQLRVSSPNLKVVIPVTVVSAITLIIIALVFRFEFGVILLSIGGSIAAIGFVLTVGLTRKVIHKHRLYKFDERKAEQELRLITYQADRAGLEAHVLNFPKTQRIVTAFDAPVRVIDAVAESSHLAALPAGQQQVNLLDVVCNEQRVLIKGASDAGKTNLLQWIASRKVATSKVLVIDPHASPDKWDGCQVVGLGSNHGEIETALDKLIELMVNRYQDIAAGKVQEGQHSKLTILIDEWMSIAYQCANAKEAIVRLLTESRKAAFSIYIGSHSDRVASLGLDGKGDLRDGFCLVRLSVTDGQRQATIDYGNGEQAAVLPGAYNGNGQADSFTIEPLDLEVQPNSTEAAILQLHRQGENHKTICEAMGWTPGGKQYQRIDEVLARFG